MKTLARWTFGIAATAIAAAVVIVTILFVINPRDEPPAAIVARITAIEPTDDAHNAGYGLWALHAAEGDDSIEAGRRAFRATIDDALKGVVPRDRRTPWTDVLDRIEFPQSIACPERDNDCLDRVLAQAATIKALAARHRVVLARIAAIDDTAVWEEPVVDGDLVALTATMAPPWPQYGAALRLSTMSAAIDLAEGRTDLGIAALERNLRIARKCLAGARTLSGKFYTAAMLEHVLLAGSQMIDLTDAHAVSAALQRVATPLTPNEYALPMRFEARYALAWIDRIDNHPVDAVVDHTPDLLERGIARITYRPQATKNGIAMRLAEFERIGRLDPATFAAQLADAERQSNERSRNARTHCLRHAFNTYGCYLVESYVPPLTMQARVLDSAALMAAVRAKSALALARVPADRVATALATMPTSARNAYDGHPFTWDAGARTIGAARLSRGWAADGPRDAEGRVTSYASVARAWTLPLPQR
ncbi:MAG: hypothetical protein ACR2GP_07625 [Burkholderiaceae bacterium]